MSQQQTDTDTLDPKRLLSVLTALNELSSLGENLIKAESGRRALEQILRNDIAVGLMEVVMLDLDGFELATLVHQHPRYQKTALIFVSAGRARAFQPPWTAA